MASEPLVTEEQEASLYSFFESLEQYGFARLNFRGSDGAWVESLDGVVYRDVLPQEVFIRHTAAVNMPEQDREHKYVPEMTEQDVTGKIELQVNLDADPRLEASISYPHYVKQAVEEEVLERVEIPDYFDIDSRNGNFKLVYNGVRGDAGGLDDAANQAVRVGEQLIDKFAKRAVASFFPEESIQEAER